MRQEIIRTILVIGRQNLRYEYHVRLARPRRDNSIGGYWRSDRRHAVAAPHPRWNSADKRIPESRRLPSAPALRKASGGGKLLEAGVAGAESGPSPGAKNLAPALYLWIEP